MIDILYGYFEQYYKKYNDFPVVTINMDEEQQEEWAQVVAFALEENRQLTQNEINKFQDNNVIY